MLTRLALIVVEFTDLIFAGGFDPSDLRYNSRSIPGFHE